MSQLDLVFTVIIPTYNRSHSLPRAIESILSQEFTNFEIIVIDDGSTDGTGMLIENRFGKLVRYVYQQNAGVCTARNLGAKLALGRFLVFLDSDDWLSENCLLHYQQAIDLRKLKLLIGSITYFNKHNEKLRVKQPVIQGKNYGQPLPGSFAILKDVFMGIGGYDAELAYAENTELFLRMKLASSVQVEEVGTIDNAGVCKIAEDVSERKSRYSKSKYESVRHFLGKHKEYFQKNPKQFINLKRIEAVCAVQNSWMSEASACMREVLKKDPYSVKSNLQFLFINFLPRFARYYYGK